MWWERLWCPDSLSQVLCARTKLENEKPGLPEERGHGKYSCSVDGAWDEGEKGLISFLSQSDVVV